MKLLGKVIWWAVTGVTVPVKKVQEALRKVGLKTEYARDPKARNAFIRAVHALEENRIVRRVGKETPKTLAFQFTKEFLQKERLDYTYEAKVVLDKETGHVEVDNRNLGELVNEKLQWAKNHFTSRDITMLIQRIFRLEADLLPLRDRGAVYFVPEAYSEVVGKVKALLSEFSVALDSLVVPDANGGKATIFRAFTDDLKRSIDTLNKEVKKLHDAKKAGKDVHTRSVTMRLRRVKKLRDRVRVYESLLDETAEEARAALRSSKSRLEAVLSLGSDAKSK